MNWRKENLCLNLHWSATRHSNVWNISKVVNSQPCNNFWQPIYKQIYKIRSNAFNVNNSELWRRRKLSWRNSGIYRVVYMSLWYTIIISNRHTKYFTVSVDVQIPRFLITNSVRLVIDYSPTYSYIDDLDSKIKKRFAKVPRQQT